MRLIVFDLDGTIVDSGAQILAAMRAGYAAADMPPPASKRVLAVVGLSLPLAVERLSPGIDAGARDRIVTAYRAAFFADRSVPPLYPGAALVLATLAARPATALAVASGKGRRGIEKVLGQHRLRRHFRTLQGGDAHPSKPDPAMLIAAMAAAGARRGRTFLVGDSVHDMAMAAAAGVRAVGVAWGYHPPVALARAGAATVVRRFADLPSRLGRAAA